MEATPIFDDEIGLERIVLYPMTDGSSDTGHSQMAFVWEKTLHLGFDCTAPEQGRGSIDGVDSQGKVRKKARETICKIKIHIL